jgi:hypothetical protein
MADLVSYDDAGNLAVTVSTVAQAKQAIKESMRRSHQTSEQST